MRDGFIYKITNTVNGKIYVGSSLNPRKRWYEHRRTLKKGIHKNRHLQRAWDKYTPDAFIFAIIEKTDEESVVEREDRWIAELKATNPSIGYNINPKANSSIGVKRSDETKAKLKALWTPEMRAAAAERARQRSIGNTWNRGRKHDPAQGKAHSEFMKGRKPWNKGLKTQLV